LFAHPKTSFGAVAALRVRRAELALPANESITSTVSRKSPMPGATRARERDDVVSFLKGFISILPWAGGHSTSPA
jgi:hypothetical protein